MFEYFQKFNSLTKAILFQILFLSIFLNASLLLMPIAAAPVYHCTTHDGGVIFTDSPAQLHYCQKLAFSMREEEVQDQGSPSQKIVPSNCLAAKPREVASPHKVTMLAEKFIPSSHPDFENEEVSPSLPTAWSEEEFSDDESFDE